MSSAQSARIVPGRLAESACGCWPELLVTAALSALRHILPPVLTLEGISLWRAVTLVVPGAFLVLAITLVYRILPHAQRLPGAMFG